MKNELRETAIAAMNFANSIEEDVIIVEDRRTGFLLIQPASEPITKHERWRGHARPGKNISFKKGEDPTPWRPNRLPISGLSSMDKED